MTINSTSITTQPTNTSICPQVGSATSLTVSATSGATYLWQYQSTATSPWVTVTATSSSFYSFTGYNTPTLSITKALVSTASLKYRVIVTGLCGSVTSTEVTVTVLGAVKGGTITSAAAVCTGSDITFTLGAQVGTSFQWQSSATATGVFSNIAGATGTTYTLVGATASSNKSYRVVVTNSCGTATTANSSVKTIAVSPSSVAGVVTGGGTVCSDGTASGTLKVTGNVGLIQWEYSTDGVAYQNAPKSGTAPLDSLFSTTSTSSAAATYIVTNITSNLYFRAKITSGACSSTYTNVVQYLLGSSAVGGSISAGASTVCSATGTTLTLSGSVGVITWYKKTVSAASYTATSIHTATYATGNLTANMLFKASLSIGGGCSPVESLPILISVDPLPKAGTITPFTGTSYAACANVAKTLKVAGSVGVIQWQSSTDNVSYTNIPGANAATYDAVISTATWFRVKATSGVCSSPSYSALPVQLTISAPALAGTLTAGNSTICATNGTTVTLSGSSSGTLVWQKSINFTATVPTWSAIVNTVTTFVTGNVLTTGPLSASTAYRVVATSGACVDYSNVMIITVIPKPVAKAITSNVTSPTGASAVTALCADLSVVKTLSVGAGYVGNIQWQKGTSATAGFVDISLATGVSYTISNPSVGANYYRVKFSNNSCSDAFSAAVTVYYKTCSAKVADAIVVSSVASAFNVVAYPNPYNETFNLSLSTSSEDKVGVVVYDMTGRLLERREVRPSDIVEQQIGARYPSGVYNVVVTQGSDVKTLRVIKR